MGGDVESVLKDVGLTDDGKVGEERVWLHCIVGGRLDEKKSDEVEEEEVITVFSKLCRRRRVADDRRMSLDVEDSMCFLIPDSQRMMWLICVGNSIYQEERKCQKVLTSGMSVSLKLSRLSVLSLTIEVMSMPVHWRSNGLRVV